MISEDTQTAILPDATYIYSVMLGCMAVLGLQGFAFIK